MREINEAENSGLMRESCDPKSPKISNHLSLFDWLRGGSLEDIDMGRRSKIFQNLYSKYGLIY